MSDLMEVSHDPYNPLGRFLKWLRTDDFRGLSVGCGVSAVLLTISMVFQANLGNGPIKQHGVVTSSNKFCSKFGGEHLQLTRNSYDAAILTSLCLLATNPAQVSLGGGGMASMLFINSTKPTQFLDFTGRGEDRPIPGFMAGMLFLKKHVNEKMKTVDNGFDRIPSLGYTHSKLAIINTPLEQLILKAVDFIESGLPHIVVPSLLKFLRVLSKNPRSFYDNGNSDLERGDLWAALSNNGNNQSYHALLDFDKKLSTENAIQLNISNGRIETHPSASKIMFALGLIDKGGYRRNERIFPVAVANAMFQSALADEQMIKENITGAIDATYEKILNDKNHIMQGKNWNYSPWKHNFKAAFVNVVGDDAEIISLTLTVGTRKFGNCQEINGLHICFSSYGKPASDHSIFPSSVIIRPNCGVCGKYTSLSGTPEAIVNVGSELMEHSGLFYGEFSERVTIGSTGNVLMEGGMESQFPEMYEAIKYHSVHYGTMPDHSSIGFASATQWNNDNIHGISDKRVDISWPAFVF